MSTHRCPVVKVNMKSHPGADSLSIMDVEGYEVCLKTEDWQDGQLAVYIPPDYKVPDIPLFSWLKTDSDNWNRIRTKRFRGRYSHGIMVPAPDGLSEGDNAMEALGIVRYVPPLPTSAGGDNEIPPEGGDRHYDIENYQSNKEGFVTGEEVVVHEKLHGCSSRYMWKNDRMWAGSRTNWKAQNKKNLWWQVLDQNPWIEEWCKSNPGLMVYGEAFGNVQSLKYGSKNGQIFFRAFDILDHGKWLDYDVARSLAGDTLQWAPELYRGLFDEEKLMELAIEDTKIEGANHKSEGIVVRPVRERYDPNVGRVVLKIVSPRYLEKAKD